jgi:acetyl esterase/lipase
MINSFLLIHHSYFIISSVMNRFLIISSFIFGAFALLSVIWILIPAPHYYVWLYSVAVSEWSLWLGIIALLGVSLALADFAFYKNSGVALISITVGVIAFLISLYPLLTTLTAAREKNVSLSFRQYFSGLTNGQSNRQFKTYVFKTDGERELKMDVYAPTENVANNGASVIVIHGGSWSAGERNDFPQWNAWLAANGYTVFDIDYTLTPQPNYLSAIGDVKCAVLQIKERSAEFNISPDKIVLLGRSAGAHLALIAAYSANDTRLPPTCAGNSNDEKVRAVVSFYAPINLLWAYDNPANRRVIDGAQTLGNFLGGNPHESDEIRARFLLASPFEQVNSNTPPTLLMHGEHDQLVRSENLYFLDERLKQNNIAHETLVISYAQHGFDYNFNGWASQIAKPVILEFLTKNTQ